MSFTESVKTVLFQKYATFKGRASRSEYWWFALFMFLTGIIGLLGEIINGIISLLIFIPSIAVTVRRLHDTNHSGLLLLGPIGFFTVGFLTMDVNAGDDYFGGIVVILGLIFYLYMLYLTIKKGDESENQYGPNPLTEESKAVQVEEADEKPAEVDLNSMTVNELKDLAAEKGVKILSKDTKAVIIHKLSE